MKIYEDVTYDTSVFNKQGQISDKDIGDARVFKTVIKKFDLEINTTAYEIMPGIVVVPDRFAAPYPPGADVSAGGNYYNTNYLTTDIPGYPLEEQKRDYVAGVKKILKSYKEKEGAHQRFIDNFFEELTSSYITNSRETDDLFLEMDSTNTLPVYLDFSKEPVGNKVVSVVIMCPATNKPLNRASASGISSESGKLGMGTHQIVSFNPFFSYIMDTGDGPYVRNPALALLHELTHALRGINGLLPLEKMGNSNNWRTPKWALFEFKLGNTNRSIKLEELVVFGSSEAVPNERNTVDRYTNRLMLGGETSTELKESGYYKSVVNFLKKYDQQLISINLRDGLINRYGANWTGKKSGLNECIGTFSLTEQAAYRTIEKYKKYTEIKFAEVLRTHTRKRYYSNPLDKISVVSFPVLDDQFFSVRHGIKNQMKPEKYTTLKDSECSPAIVKQQIPTGTRSLTQRLSRLVPSFEAVPSLSHDRVGSIDEDTVVEAFLGDKITREIFSTNPQDLRSIKRSGNIATTSQISRTNSLDEHLIEDEDLISSKTLNITVDKPTPDMYVEVMRPRTLEAGESPQYSSDPKVVFNNEKVIYVPDLNTKKTLEHHANQVLTVVGLTTYAATLVHDFTMDTKEYKLSGTSIGWDALSIIPFTSALKGLSLGQYCEAIQNAGIDGLFFIEGGILPAFGLIVVKTIISKVLAEYYALRAIENYLADIKKEIAVLKYEAIENWLLNAVFLQENQLFFMENALSNHVDAIIAELKYKLSIGSYTEAEKKELAKTIIVTEKKLRQRVSYTLVKYKSLVITASIQWFKKNFEPKRTQEFKKFLDQSQKKVLEFLDKSYENWIISAKSYSDFKELIPKRISEINYCLCNEEAEFAERRLKRQLDDYLKDLSIPALPLGQIMNVQFGTARTPIDFLQHYQTITDSSVITKMVARYDDQVININPKPSNTVSLQISPSFPEKFSENLSITTEYSIGFLFRIPLVKEGSDSILYRYTPEGYISPVISLYLDKLKLKLMVTTGVSPEQQISQRITISEFVTDNCWHHILISMGSTQQNIFLDRALVKTLETPLIQQKTSFNGIQEFYSLKETNYQLESISFYNQTQRWVDAAEIDSRLKKDIICDSFGDAVRLEIDNGYYLSNKEIEGYGLSIPLGSSAITGKAVGVYLPKQMLSLADGTKQVGKVYIGDSVKVQLLKKNTNVKFLRTNTAVIFAKKEEIDQTWLCSYYPKRIPFKTERSQAYLGSSSSKEGASVFLMERLGNEVSRNYFNLSYSEAQFEEDPTIKQRTYLYYLRAIFRNKGADPEKYEPELTLEIKNSTQNGYKWSLTKKHPGWREN